MQKLLEVVEIWLLLNLATFAFIVWYRRPNWTRRTIRDAHAHVAQGREPSSFLTN
jgi:hypothetical protein